MNLQRCYFSFILVSLLWNVHAQPKTDSLRTIWENENAPGLQRFDALKEFYKTNKYTDPNETLKISEYHLQLALKLHSETEVFWSKNTKALLFTYLSQHDSAMAYYDASMVIAKGLKNSYLEATTIGNQGNVFLQQNKYKEATHLYTRALQTFQELKNKKGEGRMLNNLGGIYYKIGDYDTALKYYEKSYEIFKDRNYKDRKMGILMLNIGEIYFKNEAYEKALSSFDRALKTFSFLNENVMIGVSQMSIAKTYHKLNDLTKALGFARKSLKVNEDLGYLIQILKSQLIIAQITYDTDRVAARILGKSILDRLPEGTTKAVKVEVFELLYNCYKDEGDVKASLPMLEKLVVYKDSIAIEKNNFAIVREAVKLDFERTLYEVHLEDERNQSALKLQQLKRMFFILFAAVLAISMIVLFFRRKIKRNKIKRAALLEELEELKRKKGSDLILASKRFELNREHLETSLQRKLNETDWRVLNVLLESPDVTNKKIAEKTFMSIDGIGSSLRRMYGYFEISETKYKKITLLSEAIKRSNGS